VSKLNVKIAATTVHGQYYYYSVSTATTCGSTNKIHVNIKTKQQT